MERDVSRALAKYKAPSSLRNWIEHDDYANALFFPADLDSIEISLVNGAMLAMYEEDDWGVRPELANQCISQASRPRPSLHETKGHGMVGSWR